VVEVEFKRGPLCHQIKAAVAYLSLSLSQQLLLHLYRGHSSRRTPTHSLLSVIMTMMAAAPRILALVPTRTLPCRRLLARTMAPTLLSFPSSLPEKSPLRRTFVSTQSRRAAPAPTPPATPAILHRSPTVEDIETAELDVEIFAPDNVQLAFTERAAEQLRRISSQREHSGSALRISVESGGCHGYQYKMELTRQRAPEDYEFEHPVVTQARVIVDAVSLTLLRGSTVDFATELIGSSFRVVNNPLAVGSGCGCGVSWEAKT